MPRPARVVEHGAGDADAVGLAAGDDLLGLLGFGDETDGDHRHGHLLADLGGERHLVAGSEGNLLQRRHAAARHVDEIAAARLQRLAEGDALGDVPAAFDPVGGGDA
ncbi:hypothetical protein RZS08_64665, partial [Arthrospira platensis SPKY1]|nr:hypothetical protein [Arthrospira platensis SPKY1]